MPIQKHFNGAYVCFRCSLRLNKRSFSATTKRGDPGLATQQSEAPPTYVKEGFPPYKRRLSITQGDLVDNEGSQQGQSDAPKKGKAQPPQWVGKVRRVNTQQRDKQPQSIALLSRATGALSRTSQSNASVEGPVIQSPQETNGSNANTSTNDHNKASSVRSVENIVRNVAVSRGLDRTKSVNRKLTAREARRLRNEEKLHQMEAEKTTAGATVRKVAAAGRKPRRKTKPVKESPKDDEKSQFTSTIDANDLSISPLPSTGPAVPELSHDLSRVLFNPGIYQLQDPRSRVYNFDPYLEKIMPVSEFDFKVLKEYITSSRDEALHSLALQHGKKYVGSSSSMTSTLSQLHFLLSQWRDVNTESLSRGFSDTLKSFTVISRSPASVFLRYRDGVYAMDADKEYDSGNILMSLGKSMEKLLTQKPEDFERYRKSSEIKIPVEEREAPEAYQYTHAGDMLMRAQLDACDSRLPGNGTFDLKTRAVASVRHNVKQVEEGVGYQIKTRFGDWESYEREYFDMMRSSFLKYSLQVRLGLMDGIFVAFHNVERVFGFQYISLPEMDMAIHGQYDTTLGDKEFRLSVELLNQILNLVAEKFPKRSLRLQFDTRNLPAGGIFMHIFAVPMDETSIDAIQNSRKEAIDAFEQRLMSPESSPDVEGTNNIEAADAPVEDLSGPEHASSVSLISVASEETATEVVESPTNEQSARDGPDAERAEQLTSNGQTCEDQAGEDHSGPEHASSISLSSVASEETATGVVESPTNEQSARDGPDAERAEQLTSNGQTCEDQAGEDHSGLEHASSISLSSVASEETATEVVESPTNEQSARDGPDAERAEQLTSNGQTCDDQAGEDQAEADSNSAKSSRAASETDTSGELLVLKLRIQNKVNGQVVKRPTNLQSSDKWSIHYSLEEETREVLARAQYRASKARRKTALEYRDEKEAATYYVRKLREMAARGAEWRKAQDELDAGREKVVLYGRKD